MFYINLIKSIKLALLFVAIFLVDSSNASETSLPLPSTEAAELKKAMDELEQALILVKRIEENKKMLEDSSPLNASEQKDSQYQGVSEKTDQDKLIADMAARLNDSAGLANQDGSITISGQCLNHQDKLILKGFVEGIREQLIKITGISFPPSAYRILVMGVVPKAKQENADKSHYKISIVPEAMPYQDAATIRLTILHPAAMNPHEFAENVIRGYLALYTYVLRDAEYTGESTQPPKWFVKGLAKRIDFSARQNDTNNILYMWTNGFIPSLEKLAIADSKLVESNDALAASLVGFWLDCDKPKSRMSSLFTKLANGEDWTPALYKETIRKNISFEELDYGFDSWLLAQRFKVLDVGTSTEDLAKRIITHLMFTPAVGIVPESAGIKWVAQKPDELAKFKDEPWAKKLAEKKQRFLIVASAGRNDEFRAAATDLIAFYQAIIAGEESESELRERYAKAEKMLFAAITREEN